MSFCVFDMSQVEQLPVDMSYVRQHSCGQLHCQSVDAELINTVVDCD